MTNVQLHNGNTVKILHYTGAKGWIDTSDQMKSQNNTLLRGSKWNRKVGFDLLTITAILDSHLLYMKV